MELTNIDPELRICNKNLKILFYIKFLIKDKKFNLIKLNFTLNKNKFQTSISDHDCNMHIPLCKREWVIGIPDKYISSGKHARKFMDLGIVNLEVKN
jgi:hypothetical protein